MRDDIETPSFAVVLRDGSYNQYVCTDLNKYQWMTDPAGTLFIYHAEHHKTFVSVKTKDRRIRALAAGEWSEIYILEDIDEEA